MIAEAQRLPRCTDFDILFRRVEPAVYSIQGFLPHQRFKIVNISAISLPKNEITLTDVHTSS